MARRHQSPAAAASACRGSSPWAPPGPSVAGRRLGSTPPPAPRDHPLPLRARQAWPTTPAAAVATADQHAPATLPMVPRLPSEEEAAAAVGSALAGSSKSPPCPAPGSMWRSSRQRPPGRVAVRVRVRVRARARAGVRARARVRARVRTRGGLGPGSGLGLGFDKATSSSPSPSSAASHPRRAGSGCIAHVHASSSSSLPRMLSGSRRHLAHASHCAQSCSADMKGSVDGPPRRADDAAFGEAPASKLCRGRLAAAWRECAAVPPPLGDSPSPHPVAPLSLSLSFGSCLRAATASIASSEAASAPPAFCCEVSKPWSVTFRLWVLASETPKACSPGWRSGSVQP
jgi:hypothetical protein